MVAGLVLLIRPIKVAPMPISRDIAFFLVTLVLIEHAFDDEIFTYFETISLYKILEMQRFIPNWSRIYFQMQVFWLCMLCIWWCWWANIGMKTPPPRKAPQTTNAKWRQRHWIPALRPKSATRTKAHLHEQLTAYSHSQWNSGIKVASFSELCWCLRYDNIAWVSLTHRQKLFLPPPRIFSWWLACLHQAPIFILFRLIIPVVNGELPRNGWNRLLNSLQIVILPPACEYVLGGEQEN